MREAKTIEVQYFGDWGMRCNARLNKEGHITPTARKVFKSGQCHALALALHEEAGLELVGLWTSGDNYDPQGNWHSTPAHMAVQLPNGSVLDIDGVGADYRWGKKYEAKVYPMTKAEVLALETKDYMEPNVEAARPFAKTLLSSLGIVPGNVTETL
jgi:hypothetical protein